jgi:hypothetical protein
MAPHAMNLEDALMRCKLLKLELTANRKENMCGLSLALSTPQNTVCIHIWRLLMAMEHIIHKPDDFAPITICIVLERIHQDLSEILLYFSTL